MIFEALLWGLAQVGALMEGAVDVFIPDAWLAPVRTALHGYGTPLLQAALYWFPANVVAAIAATIEIVFALYFARTAIRIVRGIKRVWFV